MAGVVLRIKYVRKDPVSEFVTLAGACYCFAVPSDGDIIMLPSAGAHRVVGRIWHPSNITTDVTVVVEPAE